MFCCPKGHRRGHYGCPFPFPEDRRRLRSVEVSPLAELEES